MEALESISKTLAGHRSLDPESVKSLDPEAKALQEAEKASPLSVSMDKPWGNGIGVFLNGKGVPGGDMGVAADESDGTKSVEPGTTELEREDLEDSELNGVSSLLKMKASAREIHKHVVVREKGKPARWFGSVFDVVDSNMVLEVEHDEPSSAVCSGDNVHVHGERDHRSEDGDAMNERDGDLHQINQDTGEQSDQEVDDGGGYEFSVGDFVWGKIKSHPWWPGRIYDPSDASDYAVKVKQKNRLLVAYFGDNSFSWCHASQLKPFQENFKDLSNLSHSRNFLNAVEEAINEIERLVELNSTCSCVQKHIVSALEWPLASNAGITKGVLVPTGGIDSLEPAGVIAKLKLFAKTASSSNLLDCAVLKGWLLAFYASKGCFHLPMYHQPLPITGLEDPTETLVVDVRKYSNSSYAPVQGPVEEDWLLPPSDPKFNQTSQILPEDYPDILDNWMHQTRKQKSIAEILEVANHAQTATRKDVAKKLAKSSSPTRRSKRKGIEEANDNCAHNSDSVKTTSKRTKLPGSIIAIKSQTSDIGTGGNVTKEQTVKGPLSSARRKSKDANLNDGSGQRKVETSSYSVSARRKREILSRLSVVGNDDENKNHIEGTSSPRERKKSKYLSPPYTTSNGRQKKSDIESEALVVLAETRLGERMTEAAGRVLGSPKILNECGSLERKHPEELGEKHGGASESNPETPRECQRSVIDPKKVDAPADEVITGVRFAATNPQYTNEKVSCDTIGAFLSVFRNSIYRNGCYYKEYNKRQSRRKVKSPNSGPEFTPREQDQAANDPSKSKSQQVNIGSNAEAKPSKHKIKQVARTTNKQTKEGKMSNKPKTKNAIKTPLKSNDDESDEEASPAVVFVSFSPGSSLPSKDDLIKIFSKYGPLNRKYTDMFPINFCGRVVFARSSDAEKAFNTSQIVSPFGAAKVTFQLRYLTASSDLLELKDLPSAKAPSVASERVKILEKPSASQRAASQSSDLGYIRRKLEMLTAMLETSDERMSPAIKSKLQVELKCLLEKVSTMMAA